MREVVVSRRFAVPADVLWHSLVSYADLKAVLRGQPGLDGLPERDARKGDVFQLPLRLFGLRFGTWTIRVVEFDPENHCIRTQERGIFISRWDHTTKVTADGPDACTCTDTLKINAGVFTRPVCGYARDLYSTRLKTREKLLITP